MLVSVHHAPRLGLSGSGISSCTTEAAAAHHEMGVSLSLYAAVCSRRALTTCDRDILLAILAESGGAEQAAISYARLAVRLGLIAPHQRLDTLPESERVRITQCIGKRVQRLLHRLGTPPPITCKPGKRTITTALVSQFDLRRWRSLERRAALHGPEQALDQEGIRQRCQTQFGKRRLPRVATSTVDAAAARVRRRRTHCASLLDALDLVCDDAVFCGAYPWEIKHIAQRMQMLGERMTAIARRAIDGMAKLTRNDDNHAAALKPLTAATMPKRIRLRNRQRRSTGDDTPMCAVDMMASALDTRTCTTVSQAMDRERSRTACEVPSSSIGNPTDAQPMPAVLSTEKRDTGGSTAAGTTAVEGTATKPREPRERDELELGEPEDQETPHATHEKNERENAMRMCRENRLVMDVSLREIRAFASWLTQNRAWQHKLPGVWTQTLDWDAQQGERKQFRGAFHARSIDDLCEAVATGIRRQWNTIVTCGTDRVWQVDDVTDVAAAQMAGAVIIYTGSSRPQAWFSTTDPCPLHVRNAIASRLKGNTVPAGSCRVPGSVNGKYGSIVYACYDAFIPRSVNDLCNMLDIQVCPDALNDVPTVEWHKNKRIAHRFPFFDRRKSCGYGWCGYEQMTVSLALQAGWSNDPESLARWLAHVSPRIAGDVAAARRLIITVGLSLGLCHVTE